MTNFLGDLGNTVNMLAKKGGGMKTLNSYVDEDYDLNDDSFDDEIEISDDIQIQHIQNDNTN
jgi:hypothetical protein